jgi:hypothetical protein
LTVCVGGTTVVNNAVCFEAPDHVLDRYRTRNDGEQREQRLSVDPTRSQTVRQDAPGIQFEMLARR